MIGGGCRCGAVRFRIAIECPPATYACHCTLCQRASGSSFALQMLIAEPALSVTGKLVEARVVGPSGAVGVSRYCAVCLTRLYNTNERRPGLAVVRAGTLDGSERLSPALHIFVSTKQPWVVIAPDVPAYEEGAPVEVYASLLGPAR